LKAGANPCKGTDIAVARWAFNTERQDAMAIWTVENNGRALVAFSSDTLDAAKAWVAEEGADSLGADLLLFVDDEGKALWDGKSVLTVRDSTGDERDVWTGGVAQAVEEGAIEDPQEAEDEGFLVFLVDVNDPDE